MTLLTNKLAQDLPVGAYFYGGYDSGYDSGKIGGFVRTNVLFQRIEASEYVKKIKCYNTHTKLKSDRRTNCIVTLRCDCGEIYALDNDTPVHHIQHDIILVDGKA